MSSFSLKNFTFILLIAFLLWTSTIEPCSARRGKHWRKTRATLDSLSKKKGKSHGSKSHHNNGSKPKSPPPRYTNPDPQKKSPLPPDKGDNAGSSTVFNVLKFGAKGDGNVDDTKAFQAAWASACKVEGSTLLVPSAYVFLVGPISFSGPYCKSNIVFQLDGTIIAPTGFKVWGTGLFQWLLFTKLIGITVQGGGVIDGRGSIWWKDLPLDNPIDDETKMLVSITNITVDKNSHTPMNTQFTEKMPSIKPTALRFYGSFNVTVTGIKIINSPQCHLKFDNCVGVNVFDMSVSSPGDSLNTDGIHLQNTRDVLIRGTTLACGDDCISIQTGCSNVYIHNVNCGPGHGISIGGLGKDNTKACVSNITVRDIIMHNTMNGVRIKTWQVHLNRLKSNKLQWIAHMCLWSNCQLLNPQSRNGLQLENSPIHFQLPDSSESIDPTTAPLQFIVTPSSSLARPTCDTPVQFTPGSESSSNPSEESSSIPLRMRSVGILLHATSPYSLPESLLAVQYVWFLWRAEISSYIAACQCGS